MNKEDSKEYYTKSLNKTHQQIFLEEEILPKLLPKGFKPNIIADIACGGGTLTYHISKIFPQAKFILLDLNPDAIELAREINKGIKNIKYLKLNNLTLYPFLKDINKLYDVASRSLLIILTGGHTLILKMINFNKPICFLLIKGHTEKINNAIKLESLKCGKVLYLDEITPKKFKEVIDELINDPSYKNNILKLNKINIELNGLEKILSML